LSPYSLEVEAAMRTFCDSLREKDRRRYAAVEATKLGHGGLAYIVRLLRLAPKLSARGYANSSSPSPCPPSVAAKKGRAPTKDKYPSQSP
jgi:hypothetical protein